MIAFQLLETQQLPVSAIRQSLTQNRIMRASSQIVDEAVEPLMNSLLADLIKSGVARLQDDVLVSTR